MNVVIGESKIAILDFIIFTALFLARAILKKANEATGGRPRCDSAFRSNLIVEFAEDLAPPQIAHILLLQALEPAGVAGHG